MQEIAENDPDTKEIFLDNLLDTYYPQRPNSLEDVCLHDFVANYDWQSKVSRGNRMYKKLRKLRKPRFPNQPENENQREDYYYSLILLFTPFREENSLLLESETAEEAFHRSVSSNSSAYHAKLKWMLEAQSNIKINEARLASGKEERVSEDDDPQLMVKPKQP